MKNKFKKNKKKTQGSFSKLNLFQTKKISI